jgi:protein tyrosine phosphatase
VFIVLDYLLPWLPFMDDSEIQNDPVFLTVDTVRRCQQLMVMQPVQLEFIYQLFREMVYIVKEQPQRVIQMNDMTLGLPIDIPWEGTAERY